MTSFVKNDLPFPLADRDETKAYTYTENKIEVKDPYHALEDADAPETKEFVRKINEFSKVQFVDSEATLRAQETLKKAWVYKRVCSASEQGGSYFYFGHDGVKNHYTYYKRTETGDIPFLDVNQLAEDGSISLHSHNWSDNTSDAIFGYGLSSKGSDNTTIKFRKINGEDLPDVIPNAKFSGISFLERKGVFYSKYPSEKSKDPSNDEISTKALKFHSLYYHELGTDPSKDILVHDRPDGETLNVNGRVSHCNKFLIIKVYRGCDLENELYLWKLDDKVPEKVKPTTISSGFTCSISYIGNVGNKLFYLTNKDGAKFYKVVSGNAENPSQLEDVVPQRDGFVLQKADIHHNGILLCYTSPSLETLIEFCSHVGEKLHTIYRGFDKLTGFSNWFGSEVTYFNQESFTRPVSVNKLTITDKPKLEVIERSGTELHDHSERLDVSDGWAKSKDGSKVHYFMVKPKKMRNEGPHPVLFYGYGGFQHALLPGYSISRPYFLTKYDAIFVLVNTRGGGEFGDEFYHDGRLLKKHNVFDDFLAVVKDFIDRGVTTPKLTAIEGGSNGGLLVAACARKAPELLGAVICHVGVLDMLRYPKFTIGCAWVPEYGCPDKEEHFKNLMSYSPYHNLASADLQKFPHMLVMTADHDDRVVPGHSLKYLAELYYQAKKKEVKDKFFTGLITTDAGHGAGKPTHTLIRETAVFFSFIENALGLEWKD